MANTSNEKEIRAVVNSAAVIVGKSDEKLALRLLDVVNELLDSVIIETQEKKRIYKAAQEMWYKCNNQ